VEGNVKRRKKKLPEEEQGGLKQGASAKGEEEEYVLHVFLSIVHRSYPFSDEEDVDAKARRVVRTNNFTQQTNALDVDKHMYVFGPEIDLIASSNLSSRMAYIEENLKIRSRPRDDEEDKDRKPVDPQEALYRLADRWKVEKAKPTPDEGSVTNSMSMLTAIPEVDLGMEYVSKLSHFLPQNPTYNPLISQVPD
jgi:hypothetical protein